MPESDETKPLCPRCQHKLTVFYRLPDGEVICQCDNKECALYHRETRGNNTKEAIAKFQAMK